MIAYRCPRCAAVVRTISTTPPTCSCGLTEDEDNKGYQKSRLAPITMLPVEADNARP